MSEIDKKNITSPESKSGSDSPVETYRDDLYKERKDTLGSYLSNLTKGDVGIEKKNTYSIEYDNDTVEEISVISDDGTPAPITDPPSNQDAFQNDPNIEDAIRYFKNLSEGKQEDFGGTFENVRDILNKNSQIDGHGILNNPEIVSAVSNALKVNRWTPITAETAEEDKRFPDMKLSQYNVDLNLPIDEKKKLGADYEKLRRVGRSLLLAASSDTTVANNEATNINSREENFNLGDFDLGSFIASNIPGIGDEAGIDGSVASATERVAVSKLNARTQGIENGDVSQQERRIIEYSRFSYGTLNNHVRTFEDRPGSSEMLALSFQSLASMLAISIGTYAVIELVSAGAQAITGLYRKDPGRALGTRDPQFIKHTTEYKGFAGIGDEFLNILGNIPNAFMEYLGIYKPMHVKGINGFLVYGQAVAFGIASLVYGMIKDFGFSSGFFAIMGRSVLRGESVREEIFGLGMSKDSIGAPSLDALIGYFKNLRESRSLKALNYLAKTGDIFYASYNREDTYAWTAANGNSRYIKSSEATVRSNRVFSQRLPNGEHNWSQKQALHVLLDRTERIKSVLAVSDMTLGVGYYEPTSITGIQKSEQNPKKVDPQNKNPSRFSVKQVEYYEKLLDAEYMPFYFQDLRTNEIISFHAFLTTLTDGFTPNYQAVKGYGRMDAAQIYSDTGRSIGFSFTVYATSKSDLKVMYDKIDKMITMVYPQYSSGTKVLSADGASKFTIPYSQIPTASPLLRVRIGDLIKTNRTFENVMGLFGVNEEDFQLGNAFSTELILWFRKRNRFEKEEFENWKQSQLDNDNVPGYLIKEPANKISPDKGLTFKMPEGNSSRVFMFWKDDATATKMLSLKRDNQNRFTILGGLQNPISIELSNLKEIELVVPIPSGGGARATYGLPPEVITQLSDEHHYIAAIGNRDSADQKARENIKKYTAVKIKSFEYDTVDENDLVNKYIGTNSENMSDEELKLAGVREQAMSHIRQNPGDVIVVLEKQELLLLAEFLPENFVTQDWNQQNKKPTEETTQQNRTTEFKKFFSESHNPIIKAMNSTAGTGLPGVITQLGIDWKFGEYAWELDKGDRKPMGCEISISFAPIHEITPGLDSGGANRAPVFQSRPTTRIGMPDE